MQRAWRAAGFMLLLLALTVPLSLQAANFPGEQPTYARETGFEQRFFYVSGGNGDEQIEYICRAFPGTIGSDDVSDDVWQVQRFTYDSSNRISTIAFAGDDDAYNQVCASRTVINYD